MMSVCLTDWRQLCTKWTRGKDEHSGGLHLTGSTQTGWPLEWAKSASSDQWWWANIGWLLRGTKWRVTSASSLAALVLIITTQRR